MSLFKNLFGGGSNDEEPLTPAKKIEALFEINLETIPDASYSFSREINISGTLLVEATKALPAKELTLFDRVTIRMFESGESSISFESANYSAGQFKALKKFLETVYKTVGPDSDGRPSPDQNHLNNLQFKTNGMTFPVWLTWEKNGNYTFSGELNNEISFNLPRDPSDRIKTEFYQPNAALTSNGLLSEREEVFNETEASMEYDEFEKRRSYRLTKVAGNSDPYLRTHSLDESIVKSLEELTQVCISFTYSEGRFFIHLISFDKNFQFDKDDNIIFLFDDESTIDLETIITKVKTPQGGFKTVMVLSNEQARDFAMKKLAKWKITSRKNALYQVGGFANNMYIHTYKTAREGQYILQTMMKTLVRSILQYEKNAIAFSIE